MNNLIRSSLLLSLIIVNSVRCNAQPTSISKLNVRGEIGITSSLIVENETEYLLIESAPSELGPSVYFGSSEVTPGKTYTYTINGIKRSKCQLFMYVITPHGNLVWPGSEFENTTASTSFKIPEGVNSITIGLTFLNPTEPSEAVLIQDVFLFEGERQNSKDIDLNSLPLNEPVRYNLFNSENLHIKCESGVIAMPIIYDGAEALKISSAPSKRGPSIYFGSVKIKPGYQYTYFVKGKKKADCRVMLYVTSPKGNLVWPGPDLDDGEVGVTFRTPDSVSSITLGLTFLYPDKEGESALIEDISLYAGNVKLPDRREKPLNFSEVFDNSKPWALWLLLVSFLVIAIIYVDYRATNVNRSKSNHH